MNIYLTLFYVNLSGINIDTSTCKVLIKNLGILIIQKISILDGSLRLIKVRAFLRDLLVEINSLNILKLFSE